MKTTVEGTTEKSRYEWWFNGKWYKPWTWFDWKKVQIIEDFKLISVWIHTEHEDRHD